MSRRPSPSRWGGGGAICSALWACGRVRKSRRSGCGIRNPPPRRSRRCRAASWTPCCKAPCLRPGRSRRGWHRPVCGRWRPEAPWMRPCPWCGGPWRVRLWPPGAAPLWGCHPRRSPGRGSLPWFRRCGRWPGTPLRDRGRCPSHASGRATRGVRFLARSVREYSSYYAISILIRIGPRAGRPAAPCFKASARQEPFIPKLPQS